MTSRARTGLRVLRSEGLSAVLRRTQDHLQEWRRARHFTRADSPADMSSCEAAVLNVLPTPAAAWSGGVATQFKARIEAERTRRSCAVLYRARPGYRLEASAGQRRRARAFPATAADPSTLDDPAFEVVVNSAAAAVHARAIHFEGAGGFPLASLLRLAQGDRPLILSLHDFSLFCRRPHLAEAPADQFCGYCNDRPRCTACLQRSWPVADDFQERYRATAARLLGSVTAVVYPSPFLQDRHGRLFPGIEPRLQRVIAPAALAALEPATPVAPPSPPDHLALVGAVHVHKGALIFEDVVKRLSAGNDRGLRFSVLGGGDPETLRRLRRLRRVSTLGYYRAGSLGTTLRQRGVGLALLLSITPESYCLALDECLAAGVPVLAFDHGAVGERLRKTGGGVLVDPARGAAGVLDALEPILDGCSRLAVPASARPMLPAPEEVAESYRTLYTDMGLTLPG